MKSFRVEPWSDSIQTLRIKKRHLRFTSEGPELHPRLQIGWVEERNSQRAYASSADRRKTGKNEASRARGWLQVLADVRLERYCDLTSKML
jgi:hypothetical protein